SSAARTSNIHHPPTNIQRSVWFVGRWLLDVGCWMFIFAVNESVAEIAVARPLHDRLSPAEFDFGGESGNHAAVAVAREKRPKVFQPEPAIHLREAAARDVELKRFAVAAQDVQAQRFILAPCSDNQFEMGEVVTAHSGGRGTATLA